MKLLYIGDYYTDKEKFIVSGVSKKIKSQILALEKRNLDVDYIHIQGDNIYLNRNKKDIRISDFMNSFYKSWSKMYKKLNKDYYERYDYIYIRHNYIGINLIKFLRRQKKLGTKIILEFPTVSKKPEEGSGIKNKIAFYTKKLLNQFLRGNIDLIVTYSQDDKIYGIPTAKIENCIDVNSIPRIEKKEKIKDKRIDLIGVALLTASHGYDRIIEGLNKYYSNALWNYEVYFHIVGDGKIKKSLEEKVKEYKIEKYVKFYGKVGGEKLDELFSKSDFAIGALATYRKKAMKCSELKIREYCARGIPFIYAAIEPYLEEHKEFCIKVKNNNDAIDINKIIDFCLNFDYENMPQKMRKFAIENFNWNKQFEIVFNKLEVQNENIN